MVIFVIAHHMPACIFVVFVNSIFGKCSGILYMSYVICDNMFTIQFVVR